MPATALLGSLAGVGTWQGPLFPRASPPQGQVPLRPAGRAGGGSRLHLFGRRGTGGGAQVGTPSPRGAPRPAWAERGQGRRRPGLSLLPSLRLCGGTAGGGGGAAPLPSPAAEGNGRCARRKAVARGPFLLPHPFRPTGEPGRRRRAVGGVAATTGSADLPPAYPPTPARLSRRHRLPLPAPRAVPGSEYATAARRGTGRGARAAPPGGERAGGRAPPDL